jgi:hypothetical protein
MLHSDGVVFFWHKRNGGGGWSAASFCCGQGLALNGLRHEAGGIADGALGAKSVTKKTTRGRAVGGCSKNTEKPTAIYSACAVSLARAMGF